jgi:hypothetical protein
MTRHVTICLLFLISVVALPFASLAQPPGAESVSILQLIATPEKYDGKEVLVVGFLQLQHEGTILYLHEDDWKHHINKNGLWIMYKVGINAKPEALNMKYVIVKGTFDANNKGHMSLESGAITNVTLIDTWPDIGKKKTD